MKIATLTILSLVFIYKSSFAQRAFVNEDANLPDHPRLLMLKGVEKDLPKIFSNDPFLSQVNNKIISSCSKLSDANKPARKLRGVRLLDVSRSSLKDIFYLSYAWRLTGDERYLKEAESELLAASQFSDWNPKHFLDVAEMTFAVAIGYDWLYEGLAPSSREIIKRAIYEKGLKPSMDAKNNNWLKLDNNWNQVCNASLAIGALSVYEDFPKEANLILNRSINSISVSMNSYAPNGGYPEGYNYWGYGTTYNVMLLDVIEKLFHTDFGLMKKQGFINTGYYMLNMVGPSGQPFNYGDSDNKTRPQPAMFWFARKLNNPSLRYIEQKNGRIDSTQDLDNYRFLPLTVIWGKDAPRKTSALPTKKVWIGRGKTPVALLRSSWDDGKSIFVGIKGGGKKASHGHLDVGSFVLDADGERWAMDLGMQDYESLEATGIDLWNMNQNSTRWSVFRLNNFSHNTLTINSKLQNVMGFAQLTNYSDLDEFKSAQIDMSETYNYAFNAAKRGIAIVNNSYVLLRDEFKIIQNGTSIRWSFVTDAEVISTEKNKIVLAKKGKRLLVEVNEPSNITFQSWPTTPRNKFDAANPGTTMVGFEIIADSTSKSAINVTFKPQINSTTRSKNSSTESNSNIKSLDEWPTKH